MQPGPFKDHVVLNFKAIPVRFFCGNHWMDFLKLSFGVGMRNSGWIWGCLVHPSSHSVAARSTKDSSERSCRARPRSRGKLGFSMGFLWLKSCLIGVDDLALSGQGFFQENLAWDDKIIWYLVEVQRCFHAHVSCW